MRTLALLIGAAAALAAQQTVAPTDAPVGSSRGNNTDGYNIVNSIETGYRFAEAGGDFGKYRSDVNFGNGIRLLSSFLTINSREGHGHYFDEIVLTTQGLGNDSYENATFRIQKNRIYRYDMMWRQDDYFNPALTISYGEHFQNTTRRLQDHDFTLFPQSNIKFFLGYSRNTQSGPAITTIQLFDSRGDEFPLFANIRRQRNEYRIGNEIKAFGFRLNWTRGWDDFKEDTPIDLTARSLGNNPADQTSLSSFTRREPYHGTSPYWRVALFNEGKNWYAVNGRFTYTAGRRAFVLDELDTGMSRIGTLNRQVLTYGDANRPVTTGNLNISLFPGSRLTITNSTSIYNVRTDGNSYYRVVDNSNLSTELLNFQYLGIRTIANETELNFRLNPALAFFAGYNYSNRRIRSIEQDTSVDGGNPDVLAAEQTNQLHSGILGVRFRPMKPLTIVLDGEIGRTDHPVYPVSDRNYHLLGARAQYRVRNLTLSAVARANYNTNSVSLSSFSSHARTYSADASWQARDWLSFDASYSKLHLYTVGGIAYFANLNFITGESSYYFSNIHHGNLGVRFSLRKRADLFLGYSRIQDTGDGRSTPTGRGIGSALPAFQAAQTYPLTFQSPLARFSLKLHERVRWNLGYQYYGYREEFSNLQNYRANTGYTSLLWSF
jgi:hypothetical protein